MELTFEKDFTIETTYDYSPMRKLPKQDNKGQYVGSGSGGSNRVRYPSKNRSKKV
jgi:hypothetical protein